MSITKEPFGQTRDGQDVDAFVFEGAGGAKIKVINYGGTIVSAVVPDCDANLADVVLGYDDMTGYQSGDNPYFGCCCGRYANRIAKARFTIDDVEYSLANNSGENALHGGLVGFDKKVWDAEIVGDSVKMSLTSPDGDEGYPGTLTVELIFSLSKENALRLDYRAQTEKRTVINLTNHSYFNLAGNGPVHDHLMQIHADRFTVVDAECIPSGELRPVDETEMDFLTPTPIGARIDQTAEGYDHNYCLIQNHPGELIHAATAVDPDSGRTLECWTTEPGVQFYTGNFIGEVKGKGGQVYRDRHGFCLETQHYPDSPNQPDFPNTELAPGEIYSQTCIYKFGVAE